MNQEKEQTEFSVGQRVWVFKNTVAMGEVVKRHAPPVDCYYDIKRDCGTEVSATNDFICGTLFDAKNRIVDECVYWELALKQIQNVG